jgi:hypothetical protein
MNIDKLEYDEMLATSSAAGGLKMTVHGLVYDMTAKAAKEAALGAGGIIHDITVGKLRRTDLARIKEINPNLILIAGGVDFGERDTAIYNAEMIRTLGLKTPVVYAGNIENQDEMKLIFDDGLVLEKEFTLTAIGNGKFCGGGFKTAPIALLEDGLLDVCAINKVSRFTFLSLVSCYKKGNHLQSKRANKVFLYKQVPHFKMEFEEPIPICIDGEIKGAKTIDFEVVRNAFNFVVPKGCDLIYKSPKKRRKKPRQKKQKKLQQEQQSN